MSMLHRSSLIWSPKLFCPKLRGMCSVPCIASTAPPWHLLWGGTPFFDPSTPPNPTSDALHGKMPNSAPCQLESSSTDHMHPLLSSFHSPVLTSLFSLKPNHQLDFTDPAAVKQLTRTLLHIDFGLKIDLPDNRLCPPVSGFLHAGDSVQTPPDCMS